MFHQGADDAPASLFFSGSRQANMISGPSRG
nr:MAG TPA: hypothetical protein [Caudoviricetes sp.]DAY81867.1 MAG TPA: hypothetical protein [Caudoviricetes sp.]